MTAQLVLQVIGLPTVLFLIFLGWRLLPSIRKLQRSQSHIMTTYYAFLWVVGLLNVLRCLAFVAEVESSSPLLLNLLWLLTRFGAQHPLIATSCSAWKLCEREMESDRIETICSLRAIDTVMLILVHVCQAKLESVLCLDM